MTDEKRGKVAAALKAVLNELDIELDWVNEEGTQAFEAGDYQRVEEAVQRGRQIRGFREKVASLETEWQTLRESLGEPSEETPSRPRTPRSRQSTGTLREAYRVPILQALVEMGGKARVREVLDRLHDLIKDQLNEYDLATVPSGAIRWRQRVYGTCNWMREQGLMRDDSPHGTWEITEAGRTLLAKARSDQ